MIKTFIDKLPIDYWNQKFNAFIDQLYQQKNKNQFIQELEVIADLLNINVKYLISLNYLYEEVLGCTSILYKNRGEVCLARNLDYGFKAQIMNSTQQAHYYKNGELIVIAAIIPGIMGTHTGMRVNQYAVSLNQRSTTFKKQTTLK